jgi:uncharacterized protein (UPF0548 family)
VGASRQSAPPPGFTHLHETAVIGLGDAAFERAAEALMTWRMHAGAGLRVRSSSSRAGLGEVVLCRLGPLHIPCRVVWVLDEPDARGFGYGTLPGHPVAGEESFVVRREDGTVTLTVSAYSRPALALSRLAGPVGRRAQRLAVRRYAASLRRQA